MNDETLVELRCPRCNKLLGKATEGAVSRLLRLWCRMCRREVIPSATIGTTKP